MKLFYRLANTCFGKHLIRFLFSKMTFALPLKRVRETSNLFAFYHPSPSHPFHVIIVPRQPVASLADLEPQNIAFLSELIATVQGLVKEFNLPAYRLVVNGGTYQDLPYLHFHLVSDTEPHPATPPQENG